MPKAVVQKFPRIKTHRNSKISVTLCKETAIKYTTYKIKIAFYDTKTLYNFFVNAWKYKMKSNHLLVSPNHALKELRWSCRVGIAVCPSLILVVTQGTWNKIQTHAMVQRALLRVLSSQEEPGALTSGLGTPWVPGFLFLSISMNVGAATEHSLTAPSMGLSSGFLHVTNNNWGLFYLHLVTCFFPISPIGE